MSKNNKNKKDKGKQKPQNMPIRTVGSPIGLARYMTQAHYSPPPRLGMSDLKSHRIGWSVGRIMVGDGSFGVANVLYFVTKPNLSFYVMERNVSGNDLNLAAVPIVIGDDYLGSPAAGDIAKHYARVRYKKLRVYFHSVRTGTSNSVTIYAAPLAGSSYIGEFQTSTSDNPGVEELLSPQGSISWPAWESASLDMTPFIRGGSGPLQNEFDLNRGTIGAIEGDPAYEVRGTFPCSFMVGGIANTAGFLGLVMAEVFVEAEVDFIDYIGASYNPDVTVSRSIVRRPRVEKESTTPSLPTQQVPPPRVYAGGATR